VQQAETLEYQRLDPPVAAPAAGRQRLRQEGRGLVESALQAMDRAEAMKHPGPALVIVERTVQPPRLPQLIGRVGELPPDAVDLGGDEPGVRLAVAIADLMVEQPGLLGESQGIVEAVLICERLGQGDQHPCFTRRSPLGNEIRTRGCLKSSWAGEATKQ
jgi:hypothetical protein